MMLLEVIVQSVADARAAEEGGADRLEVVRDIQVGGLTPSLEVVRAIQAATPLPLRVMVRENAGFTIADGELPTLRSTLVALAAMLVDGVVMGFARDGELALDELRLALADTPDIPVTFHRAFDTLRAPLDAIGPLAAVPQVDRILTDGGAGSIPERCTRFRALGERIEACGASLTIIAGSGVDDESLRVFAAEAVVREAHVGRGARADGTAHGPVSAMRVRRLRAIADRRA